MSSTGASQGGIFASRSGLPTFGNFGNALLERGNPGMRKSTPDSEALASSDEEVEHSRMRSAPRGKPVPNRRSSLLAEQSAEGPRRLSFASNNYSNTGSQPTTPGTQNDTWSSISPSIGAWNSGSAFPFGTNIWNANPRDPPARLQEVRQDSIDARNNYTSTSNSAVQRSMSFSVGQTDYENSATMVENPSRAGLGLTRRSSRPGTLGHDYTGALSSVNENDDLGHQYTNTSNTSAGMRPQARTMSSAGVNVAATAFKMSRPRQNVQETSEIAIEEVDDLTQSRYPMRNQPSRRLSDFQAIAPTRQPYAPPYSSASFGTARIAPHWSSNLDFGQLDTIPQSRRHSFADVPTRRGSVGSNGKCTVFGKDKC